MNNKLIIFGLLILLLPIVSAYPVNNTLNIIATVKNDVYNDGVTIIDVNEQVCIGSIYDMTNNSFVTIDQPMINISNGQHQFNFTPTNVGEYSVDIKCILYNETATYYEQFLIEERTLPISSGYATSTLYLNSEISPEKNQFIVDLNEDSKLVFNTNYYANGVLAMASDYRYVITKEDKTLKEGTLIFSKIGKYEFNYDFKYYEVGNYKIFMYFDGKMESVDVSIVKYNSDLNFITGAVTNTDGTINNGKLIFGLIILILAIIIIFGLIRNLYKKK